MSGAWVEVDLAHKKPGGCTLHRKSAPARFVTLKSSVYTACRPSGLQFRCYDLDSCGLDVAFAVLQERADEPLELLQLSGLANQQVLGDGVGLASESNRLAVSLNHAGVDVVQGA